MTYRPSRKAWVRIMDWDYDNCRIPTGESWHWSHWTFRETHDLEYQTVHKNGKRCKWWIEDDMQQVLIDLHAHADALGSAKLSDLISSVFQQWIEENMERIRQ